MSKGFVFSEWGKIEESAYPVEIPKYKKTLRKFNILRYSALVAILFKAFFLASFGMLGDIIFAGGGLILFHLFTSKARITYMRIAVMEAIQEGNVDQLLE